MTRPLLKSDKLASRFVRLAKEHRLNQAIRLFPPLSKRLTHLSATESGYAHLLEAVARLLDRDRALLPQAKKMLDKATNRSVLNQFNRRDSVALDLAEGIVAFYDGQTEHALRLYRLALENAKRIGDWKYVLAATYYLTKAYYKGDHYEEALALAKGVKSISVSESSLLYGLIAMMEAWILFVKGEIASAQKTLSRAEKSLWGRDYLDDANILAFKGRIARRLGRFHESADLYAEAIRLFADGELHPVIIRCYAQQAFSLLHLADSQALAVENSSNTTASLRQQAYDALQAVYPRGPEAGRDRTDARVFYTSAVYFNSLNQTNRAVQEIEKALLLARKYGDRSMEINSLILQDRCLGTFSVEDTRRILISAEQTDNRRLRARARIALGEAFLSDQYPNSAGATQMLEEASDLLNDSDQDYIRTELHQLESRLSLIRDKDNRLLEVTRSGVTQHGLTKTLRSAETKIIEDAWRASGGNISEVATRLGTTRTRVRRVLERREVRSTKLVG